MNKESIKIIEKIKDQASRATMVQDRSVGIIKQTCGVISKECDQALALLTEQPPASGGWQGGGKEPERQEWDRNKEQPPASDFTKEMRLLYELRPKVIEGKIVANHIFDLCYRLDCSEASREELLIACERGLNRLLELGQRESMDTLKILKAAIEKGD